MEAAISDILIGIIAVVIAAVSIYLFVRASGGIRRKEKKGEHPTAEKTEIPKVEPPPIQLLTGEAQSPPPKPNLVRHLVQSDVEAAKSNLRTLTLQRELLGTVLKRLFEAEDSGEVTREERIRLSRDYEEEMRRISDELKRSELIVTLNELENLREEIVKRFEATLNNTQTKIDAIMRELKLEAGKPATEAAAKKKKVLKKEAEGEEEKAEEVEGEGEAAAPKKAKSEVEERLEQLRKDVLKELEELDKLEIES